MQKLKERIEEELLKDQKAMHEALLQPDPDKNLVSFYEGCCASLRSVILIIEHEENK